MWNIIPVRPYFFPQYFYFVTTTAVKHIHLFKRDVIKHIVLDSLHHIRITRGMKLFVFVIMPNHIHIIAQLTDEYPLADMMRDFKKFTARQIYRQFQAEENTKVLGIMRKEGEQVKQEYKVREDGYDARDVFSMEFLQQKNGLHPPQSLPAAMEACGITGAVYMVNGGSVYDARFYFLLYYS